MRAIVARSRTPLTAWRQPCVDVVINYVSLDDDERAAFMADEPSGLAAMFEAMAWAEESGDFVCGVVGEA
jgi:hypothetical protein